MEYRKITLDKDWRDLWLGKFTTELSARGMSKQDAAAYAAVLDTYLAANKGNPREIDVKKMKAFIKGKKKVAVPALAIFYSCVARSDKHQAALEEMGAVVKPACPPPEAPEKSAREQ